MNDTEDHDALETDDAEEASHEQQVGGMDELLAYLHETRGFDFSGYKRAGLARRLGKRVRTLELENFNDYVDYLQVHPDEFANLFNSILINATSFFRDPSAWEYVAREGVPRVIGSKRDSAAVRVWCAGCATGQEAYTIAMVLADAMGLDAFSRRVKIYATDIDDDALNQARQATYTQKEVASIPPAALHTYFERSGARYVFHKDLRRSVIFGRHNLLYDAPISKIDLLLCRNTLMYFNADAQARILSSLHFALNNAGILFLGKAEMLLTHSALFTPLDLKRRLFTKVTHNYSRTRPTLNFTNRVEETSLGPTAQTRLRAMSFETSPLAQLVLDTQGMLAAANEFARRVLGVTVTDVGRPFEELAVHRKLEGLSASLQQAGLERRAVQLPASEWTRTNEPSLFFDVVVAPMVDADGSLFGSQISLLDVTAARRMQDELQQTTQELEAAYEELQSTSEELETTNEELQSTVEELESTNEELQSTNEELQGMNEELRIRTSELGRLNSYFESILASLRSAVIVLDLELHVQVWSNRAQDLWGLRADEVRGKHFLNFDIGLPVEQLSPAIRACMNGEREFYELQLPATNRRGKPIHCSVKLSRLTQENGIHGVILLMDETDLAKSSPAASS
ncbi:MAG TPA: CheR family methyltransferase [Polyangiales bacterium]|nr:CheR family methyltransferase [Polyangiales bacterium]